MGIRVLVVDDHQGFRSAVRRLLATGDCSVVGEAADGSDALRYAALLCPDVVLLDVCLPDLDGFAVAEELSRSECPPRVVLMSGRTLAELGHQLDGSRACGFLAKDEWTPERFESIARGANCE